MLIEFPDSATLLRIVVRWRLLDPARLHPYLGSMFRGALGHAFRDQACSRPGDSCDQCEVASTCAYVEVFETPNTTELRFLSGSKDAPRPYVIRPPVTHLGKYAAQDRIGVELVLMGRAISQLSTMAAALERMGEAGLGQRRARARLEEILAFSPQGDLVVVFDGQSRKKFTLPDPTRWSALSGAECDVRAVRIEILSPLRIIKKHKLLSPPSFGELMSALRRRLIALSEIHGGEPVMVDTCRLEQLTDGVELLHDGTTRTRVRRFSNRQGRAVQQDALIGALHYGPVPGELLPLLRMGSWLHVGKAATFGFGRYDVHLRF